MDDNGRDDTTLLSLSLAVRGFAASLHTMYKQNTNLTHPSVSVSIRRSAPSQTPMIISRGGGADLPHHQVEPRNNHTDTSTQGKGQNHKTQRCYTAFNSYSRSPPSPSHQPPRPLSATICTSPPTPLVFVQEKKKASRLIPSSSLIQIHTTHTPLLIIKKTSHLVSQSNRQPTTTGRNKANPSQASYPSHLLPILFLLLHLLLPSIGAK